jgi:uncharacterized membrane protein (DUF485 family)
MLEDFSQAKKNLIMALEAVDYFIYKYSEQDMADLITEQKKKLTWVSTLLMYPLYIVVIVFVIYNGIICNSFPL